MIINFESQSVGYYNDTFVIEIDDNINGIYLSRSFIILLTFIIIALLIITAIVFYFIGKNANKLKYENENINNIFIGNHI